MQDDEIMLGVFPRTRYEVYLSIDGERDRQEVKWGHQSHPSGTTHEGAYLADAYREACQAATTGGYLTWYDIFLEEVFEAMAEEDPDKLEVELIQAIAVAVDWIEDLRRKRNGK